MLGTVSKNLESRIAVASRRVRLPVLYVCWITWLSRAHMARIVEAGNHLNDNLRSRGYKRVPSPGIDLFTSEGFSRVSAYGWSFRHFIRASLFPLHCESVSLCTIHLVISATSSENSTLALWSSTDANFGKFEIPISGYTEKIYETIRTIRTICDI